MDTIYPHSLHETMRINETLQTLSVQIEVEIIKQMTNNIISEIENKQTEMKEQIIETGQNANLKYYELYADLNKIEGILNDTREDSIVRYHELREDTYEYFDAINTTNQEIKNKQTEMKEQIIETGQNATFKYHELYADVNKIKGILNETREDAFARYHELREETDDCFDAINTTHVKLKQSYDELKQHVDRNVKTTGTTYVRWGRTTCPGNGSDVIYSGYAGGSLYSHTGAAVSMLCLPTDPDWALYKETENLESGFVYGAEYEPSNGRLDQFFGTGHSQQDVPCVACNVETRSSTIMVPGKTACHSGWTLEYTGYLMSGYYDHKAARDYYCIDKDPEHVNGGGEGRNDNGYVLYFVEARCGSLKCPPYVNGMELTCVVCSK